LAELLEINPQPILSLDFKKARLLGAQELLLKPELWPENIILMDLDAVGTGSGIKEDLLRNILRTARNRQVFIGGGVRDIAEVRNLKSRGVAGVLVATALHTGQISASCLHAFMDSQKKMPR
jgi:phosphoribosylformimino-5-aminoimidazole carboxamide ribotide isomerase